MKYFIIIFWILLSHLNATPLPLPGKPNPKKRFFYKPGEFIKPGFMIRLDGGAGNQYSSKGKKQQPIEGYFYSFLFSSFYNYNYPYEWPRDTIARDNIENYSAVKQDESYLSNPGRLTLTYTHPRFMQFSLEASIRATYYRGGYTLYHIPGYPNVTEFRVYPGTRKYAWNDSQLNFVWNMAINKWLMVHPIAGVRRERRNYSKSTRPVYYDLVDTRYLKYTETSTIFNHQSGLKFHFKLSESFSLNLVSKTFFQFKGGISMEKETMDGISESSFTYLKDRSEILSEGNEHELELTYSLGSLTFYAGGNYTVYKYKISINKKNDYFPLILNQNQSVITGLYVDYFFRQNVYETEKTTKSNGGIGSGRAQYLKYFFIGVSFQL